MLNPGDRVLVHQTPGLTFTDQGLVPMPHDCSDPDQHWESRYLFDDCMGRPVIATGAERNPCHAEWPYDHESLTPITDGVDWAKESQYTIGMEVSFKLDEATPQYPEGAELRGTIISPHIEPNEWYIGFPTPEGWIFNRVVKESCFI